MIVNYPITHQQIIEEKTRRLTETEQEREKRILEGSLLEYVKWSFNKKTNKRFVVNHHHQKICSTLERVFNGEITRLIINVPPRYSKCLEENTIVFTKRGVIPIKEITTRDLVYSYDQGNIVFKKCLATEKAKKDCFTFKMRSGRSITLSKDHPMLGIDGFKKADEFEIGDRIKCINASINGEYLIDEDELSFVSFMIFEGTCTKRLSWSGSPSESTDEFFDVCKRLSIQIKQYKSNAYCDFNIMGGVNGKAATLLKKHGVYDHYSYDKRLPPEWINLPLKLKYRFLSIMFSTDGFIAKNTGQLGVTLANELLIGDIQNLISTCGIVSKISYSKNNKRGAWTLLIGRDEAIKIIDKLNLFQKNDKKIFIKSKKSQSFTNSYPSKILKNIKGFWYWSKNNGKVGNKKNMTQKTFDKCALKFPELEKYRNKEFYLDEIISINDVGEKDLIHLQIEGTENFIANGLVSHNTEIAVKCFIEWCLAKVPNSKFIHLSYSDMLALDNSSEIREDIKSDWYQSHWPMKTKHDNDTKQKWYTEEGGGVYACGTAGSITGFGAGGSDDLYSGSVIIDDPQKPSEAHSPDIRKKINERLNNTIMSRLNNPKRTPIIIIMQRLHQEDMTGFCLNNGTGEKWEHLSLPVLDEDNNPLWPFKHDYEQIMKIKIADNRTFYGQYMQDPRPDEGALFKMHWFKLVDVLPPMKRTIRAWDRASTEVSSKNKNPDWTVGLKLGEDYEGNLYVMDIKRARLGPFEVEQLTLNTARLDGVSTKIKIFKDPGSAGEYEAKSYVKLLKGFDVEVEKITKDKITAARPVSAQCEAGMIYVLNTSWTQDFLDELISFPDGAHDDQVDALSSNFNSMMGDNVGTFTKSFIQEKKISVIGGDEW